MMDLDEPELFGGVTYPDEESGSAYEESSENGQSSHDEEVEEPVTLKAKPEKTRGRSTTRNATENQNRRRRSSSTREEATDGAGYQQDSSSDSNDQIFEDAREWAATFQPPAVEDIKTPTRRRSRKRRVQKPPSETRAKRLKAYYGNDYRELLNTEVNEAAHGALSDDQVKSSQIGCSTWAAEEKDLFFSSLARLGRYDAGGIAVQIDTKSEPEVQEYLQLLQADITERKRKGAWDLMTADLPAATEISDECCIVLERAGDALAARQEVAEEKVEKSKWSDIWLVDEEVSLLIDRRRREEGGEEALDALLPAGNLFILKNWLALSRRVFMNPGTLRDEENWENLAEPGERPAIRATAFEDFHSLAVNITKRLLSTTIFCAMSRLRSRDFHHIKVSEVTAYDVEAAVNMLGLKSNSDQFWLECSRRNNLEVVDDGDAAEEKEAIPLTYQDVEEELRRSQRSRSRSLPVPERSRPSSQASVLQEHDYSSPSEIGFEDFGDFASYSSVLDEDEQSGPVDSPELTDQDSPGHDKRTRFKDRKAAERSQEAYTEALDKQASQKEEARLWATIEQEPPFEIETELEELERPRYIRDDVEDGRNWRDHLEYWSPWETLRTPVPQSEFERNRKRKSRRAKAREKGTGRRREDSGNADTVADEEALDEDFEDDQTLENGLQEEAHQEAGEEDRNDMRNGIDGPEQASPRHAAVSSDDPITSRYRPTDNRESSDDDFVVTIK